MTDVKKQHIEDYKQGECINWKQKFFKTVPYIDENGNEVQQDPKFSNPVDIIGEQNSTAKYFKRYDKKNKRKK